MINNLPRSQISRYKQWKRVKLPCHGFYLRNICIHGIHDLPVLCSTDKLYLNKLFVDYQPYVYQCLEELVFDRTREQMMGGKYKQMSDERSELHNVEKLTIVKHHLWSENIRCASMVNIPVNIPYMVNIPAYWSFGDQTTLLVLIFEPHKRKRLTCITPMLQKAATWTQKCTKVQHNYVSCWPAGGFVTNRTQQFCASHSVSVGRQLHSDMGENYSIHHLPIRRGS